MAGPWKDRKTFLEDVATFAKTPSTWKPSTYKTGKRKGHPCMRNERGQTRDMSESEKVQHRPDLAYDLDQPLENRILADQYDDRGEPLKAAHHRERARWLEVNQAVADAMHHLQLHAPPERERPVMTSMRKISARTLHKEAASRTPGEALSVYEFAQHLAHGNGQRHMNFWRDGEGGNGNVVHNVAEASELAKWQVEPYLFGPHDPHRPVRVGILMLAAQDVDRHQPDVSGIAQQSIHELHGAVREIFPGITLPEFRRHLARMDGDRLLDITDQDGFGSGTEDATHVVLTEDGLRRGRLT